MATPICLDESIHTVRIARDAIAAKACRIINIKPGRVGGHQQSIELHDLCAANDIPVWHGGMLESGIGRAHNIHLASLPNFRLPGDIAASQALLRAGSDRAGHRHRRRRARSRCRPAPALASRCCAIASRRPPSATWSSTPARSRDEAARPRPLLAAVLMMSGCGPKAAPVVTPAPPPPDSEQKLTWILELEDQRIARGAAAGQDLVVMLADQQAHIRRRAALAARTRARRRGGGAARRRCWRPNPIPKSARWRRLRSGLIGSQPAAPTR